MAIWDRILQILEASFRLTLGAISVNLSSVTLHQNTVEYIKDQYLIKGSLALDVYYMPYQSKRFDPEGKFIRKYCLELADVPSRALHDATRLAAAIDTSIDYPKFIVDHKFARERALAEFKAVG